MSKNTRTLGVQDILLQKSCTSKSRRYCLGHFLLHQTWPRYNPYSAQIRTPQSDCLPVLLLKMCWNTCFTMFLDIKKSLPKIASPRTITFHMFKTQVIKQCCAATSRFTNETLFYKFSCFANKSIVAEETQLKIRKKTKIRTRHLKDKIRQETKQQKWLMKDSFQIQYNWTCALQEREANKQGKKTRERQRQKKDTRKENKEGRHK